MASRGSNPRPPAAASSRRPRLHAPVETLNELVGAMRMRHDAVEDAKRGALPATEHADLRQAIRRGQRWYALCLGHRVFVANERSLFKNLPHHLYSRDRKTDLPTGPVRESMEKNFDLRPLDEPHPAFAKLRADAQALGITPRVTFELVEVRLPEGALPEEELATLLAPPARGDDLDPEQRREVDATTLALERMTPAMRQEVLLRAQALLAQGDAPVQAA